MLFLSFETQAKMMFAHADIMKYQAENGEWDIPNGVDFRKKLKEIMKASMFLKAIDASDEAIDSLQEKMFQGIDLYEDSFIVEMGYQPLTKYSLWIRFNQLLNWMGEYFDKEDIEGIYDSMEKLLKKGEEFEEQLIFDILSDHFIEIVREAA